MTDPNLDIRPFVASDHSAVVSLWREVFQDRLSWNEPAKMIERKGTIQPQLFLVANEGGCVIGTVMAGFDGVRGWIHHLAVHPSARRRGIATRLMRVAEEGLAKLGCPKVNLQVRAENTEVLAFYRSLGYHIEDRVSLGKRLGRENH